LSWSSFGLAWIPVSPWKKFDVIINWAEIENTSPGYDLRVFSGSAGDQFPANYVDAGLDFRLIALIILDHPADVVFSKDGINDMIGFRSEGGYLEVLNARYFKIKNANPGFIANYQLTVIN
jgi:hypothetical protein